MVESKEEEVKEAVDIGERPAHLEVVEKDEFMGAILEELAEVLISIRLEESHLVEDQPLYNVGTVQRINRFWSQYAAKLDLLLEIRSAPEGIYVFVKDTVQGGYGLKHKKASWGCPKQGAHHEAPAAQVERDGRFPSILYL